MCRENRGLKTVANISEKWCAGCAQNEVVNMWMYSHTYAVTTALLSPLQIMQWCHNVIRRRYEQCMDCTVCKQSHSGRLIQYEALWCQQSWLMQVEDKKSFLTHKLDAQVICCFRQQEEEGEGRREKGREHKVINKNSACLHCVTAYIQIITDLLSFHVSCCIGISSVVTWG